MDGVKERGEDRKKEEKVNREKVEVSQKEEGGGEEEERLRRMLIEKRGRIKKMRKNSVDEGVGK